jgi:hypothetical protein
MPYRHPLAILVTASALAMATALAVPAGAESKVLGAAAPAQASCPASCVVEARVTGFQTTIGRTRNPFSAPAHGRIVAWSIKLGTPAKEDMKFFNERFGRSQARISILKPFRAKGAKNKKGKLRYRLLRHSPVQDLQPFFGETTTFGLAEPLRVRKGNVVALTMPTWAPAFSIGQRAKWRASRAPSDANGPCSLRGGLANLEAGEAQQRPGSQRRYGCAYKGARLLYSARFLRGKQQD